jgi:hypothetical protein
VNVDFQADSSVYAAFIYGFPSEEAAKGATKGLAAAVETYEEHERYAVKVLDVSDADAETSDEHERYAVKVLDVSDAEVAVRIHCHADDVGGLLGLSETLAGWAAALDGRRVR